MRLIVIIMTLCCWSGQTMAMAIYTAEHVLENGQSAKLTSEQIFPDNHRYYWRLDRVDGDYYIQVQRQLTNLYSDSQVFLDFLYLNGKLLRFSSSSPLEYRDNKVFITSQTALVRLKSGDVLQIGGNCGIVLKMELTQNPLSFAPLKHKNEAQRLRMVDKTWDYDGTVFDRQLSLTVNNRTGSSRQIKLSVKIVDYFQNQLAGEDLHSVS